MAEHLWRRGARYYFQKRVPRDLVSALGSNPIRVALPHGVNHRDARRLAAMLAGSVETHYALARRSQMTRNELVGHILTVLRESVRLHAQTRQTRDEILDASERGETGLTLKFWDAVEYDVREATLLESEVDCVTSLMEQEASFAADDDLAREVRELRKLVAQLTSSSANASLPKLSEALPEYLSQQTAEKGEASKWVRYTVPNALDAFVELIGDRPLDQYRAGDLETFASMLARVPASRKKILRFRRVGLAAAADLNAASKRPVACLSATSIKRSYVTPVQLAVGWLCRQNNVRSPFADVRVRAPRTARGAVERDIVTSVELNQLFAAAARSNRPDDRWLPLLGFCTGARLGERKPLGGPGADPAGRHPPLRRRRPRYG